MSKLRAIFIALVFVLAVPMSVLGDVQRDRSIPESYVYNHFGGGFFYPTPAPLPYRFSHSMYAQDIGVDSFLHLNEIEYHNGQFFITNGSSLIITDNNLRAVTILEGIYVEGQWEEFTPLDGIFITDTGEIYIAEPNAGRVLHLDENLNLVRTLGRPEGMAGDENATFRPLKVAVDNHGRIYIIAEGVFEGIVELNPDGTFNRYFGVVDVHPTAWELFRSRFQTNAQRIRTRLWLPNNFSNIAIDPTGFVFATLSDPASDVAVKMLNFQGENILRRPSDDHSVGDMDFNRIGIGIPQGPSIISIVQVTDFGVYYAFDNNRNRVFAYDQDGHNLFAFGGTGTREGTLTTVTGMTLAGNRLVFADRGNRSIEVFERTVYGNLVMAASERQFRHDYMGAAHYWGEVLRLNPFFNYAYVGVGIALYRQGYYDESMIYFQRGQDVEFFSMAYQRVRAGAMYRHFNTIMTVISLLVVAYILHKIIKRVLSRQKLRSGVA